MKWLFSLVFSNKKYLIFFIISCFILIFETTATRLEHLTLGILADSASLNDPADLQIASQSDWMDMSFPSFKEIIDNPKIIWTWLKSGHYEKGDLMTALRQAMGIDSLSKLITLTVSVACLKALTLFSASYIHQRISICISTELRERYFAHLQNLSLDFYQKFHIGSLSNRVATDANTIADSLQSILTNYVQTPLMLITGISACLIFSTKLSLVVFVGAPLIVIPVAVFTKRIKAIAKQLLKNQESLTSVLIDFLSGIQTVKLFAMEAYSLKKYKEENDRLAKLQSKSARYTQATRPIVHLIGSLTLALTILLGLFFFHMTLAELLGFAVVLHSLYDPLKKFAEENGRIQRGVAAAERMSEVLNIIPQIQDHPQAVTASSLKDAIIFDNVCFEYPDTKIPVLKNVSFSIKKGKTTAIVGASGSGKSTIAQLIPRLYEVTQGAILFDGIPIDRLTQKSLREQIAFVPQKPFLFSDTIKQNISYGQNFSIEDIQKAAQKAYADEFIEKLPLKYDSILAEAGKDLSGGQQQRLAIARALVKQAPILIMDEATSALDNLSEKKIQASIENLKGKMTQIIIAHRLTTIEHADDIIFLDQGIVIDQGSKHDLLNRCPLFKQLWSTMQSLPSDQEAIL